MYKLNLCLSLQNWANWVHQISFRGPVCTVNKLNRRLSLCQVFHRGVSLMTGFTVQYAYIMSWPSISMPPALDHPSLNLILFNEPIVIYKLQPNEILPDEILKVITRPISGEHLISVTRTAEEVSVVCNTAFLPNVEAPRWKSIKIRGPLDFGKQTSAMCYLNVSLYLWF